MDASLRKALTGAVVPADAAPMATYMKDSFRFLGVRTPARRRASRPRISASKHESISAVLALAYELQEQPEREFHYVAGDLLRENQQRLHAEHIGDLEHFVAADAWWDTVDALASPTIGTMIRNHPELAPTLDQWIDDDDVGLARVAIIRQLRFGAGTDPDRLFRYALHRAGDPEFFIRNAMGWALREYAKSDPDAVRSFVDDHCDVLAPLTVHEGTKHVGGVSRTIRSGATQRPVGSAGTV